MRGGAHVVEAPLRVTVLVQGRAGWARLCRLVSVAHARAGGGHPVASWEALREHAGEGLVVLLGPMSEPVRALAAGRADVAQRLLAPWRELLGDSLRLEAVCFGLPGMGPGSVRLAAHTLRLGDRLGIQTVLTNAVRYVDPAQHRTVDVLDAARLLRPISFHDRSRLDSGQRWLKPLQAMAQVALRVAEAAGHRGPQRARRLLEATEATAQVCGVDPVADLGLGRPRFPEPEVVGARGADGAVRLLRDRAEQGLRERGLDRDRVARERLEKELEVITRLGFAPYFLTVAQVVADIRQMGIRVAARGSGAGSLANYCLRIATANPLEHRLLMERFLSVRRRSLPDIDLDVESARRLEVYRRIFSRFGAERVAVVAMPETYRARRALRDVGLALGIAPQSVDEVAKAFPHIRAAGIRAALQELPELRRLAGRAARFGPLFHLAEQLDGLVHGMAMHPCGIVLTDSSLRDRLPVQPTATEDRFPMVQAAKEEVEAFGLIKLDVLGVRMQSAMAHAVDEIERVAGRRIDLDDPSQVPLDDFFAFKMIQASDTVGLFQLESPGQMDLLGRLQPRNPQDVIADISLFRPGPVAGGMPEQYIAARHGRPPRPLHPDLQPVLADTYGVVIWHEQIIKIISALTGCDLALAELARRALGDQERRQSLRNWFMREASARGYSRGVLERVWGVIEAFGAYGFCRAHAVAFAVPALQSAWLKAHFPAALYAGLLEHDPGMWDRRVIVADARRHGVPVLPVDVNRSRAVHSVVHTSDGSFAVRLSFSQVKGISDSEVTRLVAGQPYSSLQDVWQRARPSRPTAERLALIGAFDALAGPQTRRDLLLHIHELHRHSAARTVTPGQLPLDDGREQTPAPSGLAELTGREAVGAELGVLGIDVSAHLMEHHRRLLAELGATDAAHLGALKAGQPVLVAGVRASTQTPPVASGARIIFVTLEDGSGMVDLVFFEKSHPACAHTVFHCGLLLVRGTISSRGPRNTVVATMAWDLEVLAATRRDHGPEAVLRLLATGRLEPSAQHKEGQTHRSMPQPTGAQLHPWADLGPTGSRSADVSKLGYTSPGSAG